MAFPSARIAFRFVPRSPLNLAADRFMLTLSLVCFCHFQSYGLRKHP